MLYNLSNEFVKISETSGTIQNTSQAYAVEISDITVEGTGYILYPLNKVSFSGEIYMRCAEPDRHVRVNVVTFINDSGGGDSGEFVDDSEVITDGDLDDLLNDAFSDNPSDAPQGDAEIDELLDNVFG